MYRVDHLSLIQRFQFQVNSNKIKNEYCLWGHLTQAHYQRNAVEVSGFCWPQPSLHPNATLNGSPNNIILYWLKLYDFFRHFLRYIAPSRSALVLYPFTFHPFESICVDPFPNRNLTFNIPPPIRLPPLKCAYIHIYISFEWVGICVFRSLQLLYYSTTVPSYIIIH